MGYILGYILLAFLADTGYNLSHHSSEREARFMDPFGVHAVMTTLEPYLPVIDGVIRDGFGKLWTYEPEILADYDEAAAAKCIHRHQVMLARQRLHPLPGVNVINARGLEVVDIHGEVGLRFKKVNGAGRGRNIETLQQLAFDRQLPLPGVPDAATRVVAGYKPNATRTGIEKVLIAARWAGRCSGRSKSS